MMDENTFQKILEEAWKDNADPSHDIGHVRRVVKMAKAIGSSEHADLSIIIPAAWLHDCVNLAKNSPDRAKASHYSADYAVKALRALGSDEADLSAIHHAIEAHSFSANITPRTIEAKIVQDADRLESLGAIGIARTFAVSGLLGRELFDSEDPLAEKRVLDDQIFGLDHFFVKLFKIADTLHTQKARAIAQDRIDFMRDFVSQIRQEAG